MPASTGMADPELPMPGEPEEEEPAGGGGRGPCCWATAGIANTPAAQARERMILAARRWMRDKVASFADMFILCALPFSVWTLRIRLVKRAGGCMASEGGGIPIGWKGPVVNSRSSVGPWRSWERASMASRRSWVRIPSAPPIEETKELTRENRYLLPATVASSAFSSCIQ